MTSCPQCQERMLGEKGKLNLQIQYCANDHGVFVEPNRLKTFLAQETLEQLVSSAQSGATAGACPSCGSELHGIALEDLSAQACADCTGLWFPRSELARFRKERRARAYGPNAFASRGDVLEEADKLYAAEVIAGILTEYEMSLQEQEA